jgi:hypothetical protein
MAHKRELEGFGTISSRGGGAIIWPTASAVGERCILVCFSSPGRGDRVLTLNYQARIKLHSMSLAQRHNLFLLCQSALMLLLRCDVRFELNQRGLAEARMAHAT